MNMSYADKNMACTVVPATITGAKLAADFQAAETDKSITITGTGLATGSDKLVS